LSRWGSVDQFVEREGQDQPGMPLRVVDVADQSLDALQAGVERLPPEAQRLGGLHLR